MFPTLFSIGGFSLHTYGLFIALGFFASIAVNAREARLYKIPKEVIMDITMLTVFVGLIGARVLYIITRWEEFMEAPLEMFKIWNGGIVWYGALIAGTVAGIIYTRKKQINTALMADILAPGIALGEGVGRIGCLAAGCCFGKPADLPWSITFTNPEGIARPLNTPLHPTQPYMFLSGVLICVLVVFIRSRMKRAEKGTHLRHGVVAASYLMLYAIFRSIIEMYRGDTIRGFVVGEWLSTSQFISLFTFSLGALLLVWSLKRHRQAA